MVGLVAVGDSNPNLAAAKGVQTNPEAKKRFDADFAKLGQKATPTGVMASPTTR